MVEPHDFQADGPGIVGSDICTICGKEREDHEPREWLIRKGGYYYRPNCAGYTTSKFEAGRYTKAEAEREAAVEPWHMKAVHQDDVEDDPVSARVRMDSARIAALEAQLAELEAENERLRTLVMAQSRAIHSPEALSRTGAVKVDELAQEIRRVDGGNSLGAGALAEALMPFLSTLESAAPEGQQPVAYRVHAPADEHYGIGPDRLQFHPLAQYDLDTGYRQTPLYTRPSEQAVTEAMAVCPECDGQKLMHGYDCDCPRCEAAGVVPLGTAIRSILDDDDADVFEKLDDIRRALGRKA